MKKVVLAVILVFSLVSISYFPVNVAKKFGPLKFDIASDDVIFRDDFDNKSSHWEWITKITGKILINNGIAEFKIPIALKFGHFDAEIVDKELAPYKYNAMETRIRVDPVMKGSRGWGFWNFKMEKSQCQLAWFIFLKGRPGYSLNGFWAQCVDGNLDNLTLMPIRGYDISEWHTYEIDWNEKYVEFYIDGNLVANVSKGVPKINCKVDVWIDNAVWLEERIFRYYIPVFNRIWQPTTLYLDYIEITE